MILDRKKEIAHTQNQIKHSVCTVYTVGPEDLEKMLNGRNGMERPKGSQNKSTGIMIQKKQLALKDKTDTGVNKEKIVELKEIINSIG